MTKNVPGNTVRTLEKSLDLVFKFYFAARSNSIFSIEKYSMETILVCYFNRFFSSNNHRCLFCLWRLFSLSCCNKYPKYTKLHHWISFCDRLQYQSSSLWESTGICLHLPKCKYMHMIIVIFYAYLNTHLQNKLFALKFKFWRNTSEFPILVWKENPHGFFIFSFFILINFHL